MNERHFLIDEKGDYDVTSPEARDLYWKLLPSTLVSKGLDASWLDASEPEVGDLGIPPGRKLNFGASTPTFFRSCTVSASTSTGGRPASRNGISS
jgi:alpha-glucosidase (family GH31 glycosyl hydrolase)